MFPKVSWIAFECGWFYRPCLRTVLFKMGCATSSIELWQYNVVDNNAMVFLCFHDCVCFQ